MGENLVEEAGNGFEVFGRHAHADGVAVGQLEIKDAAFLSPHSKTLCFKFYQQFVGLMCCI
jgi:hypothetical protein